MMKKNLKVCIVVIWKNVKQERKGGKKRTEGTVSAQKKSAPEREKRIVPPVPELLEVPGDFTPSAFVQSVTGVDNVCERAALRGADKLVVKKTALNGVTVAVAAEKLEVRFG